MRLVDAGGCWAAHTTRGGSAQVPAAAIVEVTCNGL